MWIHIRGPCNVAWLDKHTNSLLVLSMHPILETISGTVIFKQSQMQHMCVIGAEQVFNAHPFESTSESARILINYKAS